jgi:D-3-phosphoglycerate dehydrogenase
MTYTAAWIDPHPFPSLDMDRRILGEAGIALRVHLCGSEDEVIDFARDTDILMVITANQITRRILSELTRCKAIIRHGIGLDSIDVEAATDLGVLVVNNTTYCVEEVSDMAMALLLTATRRIPRLDRKFREGVWDYSIMRLGFRLRECTLGLVGLGRIGRRVAAKAAAFGMRLLAHDPYVSPDTAADLGVSLVSLEAVLGESDFISLHCPLTSETFHLVGERELRMMKSTAFLINTSRGGIVDTPALVTALEEKWIAGAALDAHEEPEPVPADHPITKLENAILTPHIAWYSEQAMAELQEGQAHEAVRVLRGEMPMQLANPEVLLRPTCRVRELRAGGV